MLNVKKKIYPKPKDNNYDNLSYDEEGLWSITHPENADNISESILSLSSCESKIIDLTAGCGGNLISFSKYFNNVTGVEIDEDRFFILSNNIKSYSDKTIVLNDNCLNFLDKDYDIFFIDPPWGGPEYKSVKNLKLYLSNAELSDVINKIKNRLIVIKIPYNYDYEYIQQKYNVLKFENYNNIIIIYFKTFN